MGKDKDPAELDGDRVVVGDRRWCRSVMVKDENREEGKSRGSGEAGEDRVEDRVEVVERGDDCYNVIARGSVESNSLLKISICAAYIHVVAI